MPETPSSDAAHADIRRRFDSLFHSPELFPRELSFSHDRIFFTTLSELSYRDTAFLSGRIAGAGAGDFGLHLSRLVELFQRLHPARRTLHYLFHVGHCGSTLVSRMLGSLPGVLSLREPWPLFALAQGARALRALTSDPETVRWRETFELTVSLMSRTFRSDDVAVIKPMSHANNLIPELLGWTPACRGILLYVDLKTYLATMLRPAMRRETARAVANSRLGDFHARAGVEPPFSFELDDARKAALVWLIEMREFADALEDPLTRDKLRSLEFGRFLKDSRNELGKLAAFLGLHAGAAELEQAVGPRVALRYSKHTAYAFDARARDRMLEESNRIHSSEIQNAIAWTGEVASRCPMFADLCETVRTAEL